MDIMTNSSIAVDLSKLKFKESTNVISFADFSLHYGSDNIDEVYQYKDVERKNKCIFSNLQLGFVQV